MYCLPLIWCPALRHPMLDLHRLLQIGLHHTAGTCILVSPIMHAHGCDLQSCCNLCYQPPAQALPNTTPKGLMLCSPSCLQHRCQPLCLPSHWPLVHPHNGLPRTTQRCVPVLFSVLTNPLHHSTAQLSASHHPAYHTVAPFPWAHLRL